MIDGLFAKREGGGISGMLSTDMLDFSNADFSHLNLNKQQVPEVRWFKKWREADLSGADLHQAELKHADFTGAIMHGADLSGAKLGGAVFQEAQLQGAYLRAACLQNPPPHFYNSKTGVSGANLSWVHLCHAHIDVRSWRSRFFATDFSDAVVARAPSLHDDMEGKIWHSGQKAFDKVKEQQDKNDWGLNSCSDVSTSALVGAFRNYTGRDGAFFNSDQSMCFWEAAVALPSLPDDFPNIWRKRLARAKKTIDSFFKQP